MTSWQTYRQPRISDWGSYAPVLAPEQLHQVFWFFFVPAALAPVDLESNVHHPAAAADAGVVFQPAATGRARIHEVSFRYCPTFNIGNSTQLATIR